MAPKRTVGWAGGRGQGAGRSASEAEDGGEESVGGLGTRGSIGDGWVGVGVFAGFAGECILEISVAGHATAFTDTGVLQDYSAVTGYGPGVPSTDGGTNVRE